MKVGLISNAGIAKDRLLHILSNRGVDIEYIGPPSGDIEFGRFDIIHLFPGYHLLNTTIRARLLKKKIVNQWIGTDVMSATKYPRRRITALITNKICNIQIAVSPFLTRELKRIGISSYVIPNVPEISYKTPVNSPKKNGVIVYIPEDRYHFHRGDTILNIASKFPSINFHIVANEGKKIRNMDNIHYHGFLSDDKMEELWSKVNVLLRIPYHDGLPLMILEALARGKYVVWTYPFHSCYRVKKSNDIINALNEIFNKIEPNLEGRSFVLNHYNPDLIAKKYKRVYNFV